MTTFGIKPALLIIQHVADNEFYRKAVESPDYVRAVQLREHAIRLRGGLPLVHPPLPPSTVDEFTEWLDAVVDADTAERARAAKVAALNALIAQCESNIQGVVMSPDPLLSSLAADMRDLMGQVDDTVNRLGGAHTPNEVIAAGRGDVWNELIQLRALYDAIRQAQDWVMTGEDQHIWSRSRYLDDPLATDCAIANLDDVFPAWREPRPEPITSSWGGQPDPRPWPQDPIAQLVWLSSSDAKVWVPTLRQLDRLAETRRARHNPAPKVKPGRPDKALINKPLVAKGLLG